MKKLRNILSNFFAKFLTKKKDNTEGCDAIRITGVF
jgi:hypothetical protein